MKARYKPKTVIAMIKGGAVLLTFSFLEVLYETRSIKITSSIYIMLALLVVALYKIQKNNRQQSLMKSGIEFVDKMSGQEFEEFLLAMFNQLGYNGKLTSASGDYGADLIITNNKTKIAVQAKRYKGSVGVAAVQEIIGALKYYDVNVGIVVINSRFTQNAINLAKANGIELWDREKLICTLAGINGRRLIEKERTVNYSLLENQQCPQCGCELILKNGKYGEFIGCTGFPECKFTKNI